MIADVVLGDSETFVDQEANTISKVFLLNGLL